MESKWIDAMWWCVLATASLGLIVPVVLLLRWLLAQRRTDSVVDWGGRLDKVMKRLDGIEDMMKKFDTLEDMMKKLDVTPIQSTSESTSVGHSHRSCCCHAHHVEEKGSRSRRSRDSYRSSRRHHSYGRKSRERRRS